MGNGRVRPEDEGRRRRRREEARYEEEYTDEYGDDEYEEPPVRRVRPRTTQRFQDSPQYVQRTRRAYPPTTRRVPRENDAIQYARPRPRPQRKRSVWPVLLGGCALGVLFAVVAAAVVVFFTVRTAQTGGVPIIGGTGLGGTQTFKSDATQPITLSNLAQMQICNKIGNVSVVVDPNADSASIETTKIARVSDKTSANSEFGRIHISIQQPPTGTASTACASSSTTGTPATTTTTPATSGGALLVNTTIPDSDGLIHGAGDAVDIKVTLTPKLLATEGAPLQLNIQAALGDINVDGVSGVFNIIGSSGNVKVTHATLISGSSIGTGQGNVTFNGIIAAPSDTTTQANFVIRNETGNLDITLPGSTNVVLSANTNVGTIQSDFPIHATTSSGSANYRGPLNAAAATQSTAILTLDVSTGNIAIHRM